MMSVCLRGWGSGWREFELESVTQLKEALVEVGVNLTGFDAFMMDGGEGQQIVSGYKEEAHATGFVGTPHYVFTIIKEIGHSVIWQRTPRFDPF